MFHEDAAGGWQLVAVDVNKPHGRAPACLQVNIPQNKCAAYAAGVKYLLLTLTLMPEPTCIIYLIINTELCRCDRFI